MRIECTYTECHLRRVDELVPLKQSSGGVYKDGVGDTVNQVEHSLLDLISGLGAVNGLLKHHSESLHHKPALKSYISFIHSIHCPQHLRKNIIGGRLSYNPFKHIKQILK